MRQVPFADIQPFIAASTRDGVVVKENPKTIWYAIEDAGFLGLRHAGRTWRLVGIFIVPERRGEGLGMKATLEAICLAREAGVAFEAVAYRPDFYLPLGFRVVRVYHSASLVRLEP